MQHYLELDVADLRLLPAQRRSSDSYTDGVNDQFLLDATRGRFTVMGEVFHYAEATKAGESEVDFVSRLLNAVRAATLPALLAPVTLAMSQSGLAALERASLCIAAVSGGSQRVDYTLELEPGQPGAVRVSLQLLRQGFQEYLLSGTPDEDIDDAPRRSDRESWLKKAATVVLGPGGDVDVVHLEETVDVCHQGRRLPSSDFFQDPPAASAAVAASRPEPTPRCLSGARGCARRLCRRLAAETRHTDLRESGIARVA
ncbi:unnamed protein product [Polarella glacialis]|nr:unnamed protein product [Polarella glacialis]